MEIGVSNNDTGPDFVHQLPDIVAGMLGGLSSNNNSDQGQNVSNTPGNVT